MPQTHSPNWPQGSPQATTGALSLGVGPASGKIVKADLARVFPMTRETPGLMVDYHSMISEIS